MSIFKKFLFFAFLLVLVTGCSNATKPSPRVINFDPDTGEFPPIPKGGGIYKIGKPYKIEGQSFVPRKYKSYSSTGIASWYGRKFHGRYTANGEIFDMESISAAHPLLPMPSLVKVTNLENGRKIIVRVNDRGPFKKNREIDLSKAAAEVLGFKDKGTVKVKVELIRNASIQNSEKLERQKGKYLQYTQSSKTKKQLEQENTNILRKLYETYQKKLLAKTNYNK